MKRSEINACIREAELFFRKQAFHLPPWAFWTPDDWRAHAGACGGITARQLGWDLTDFGRGDFRRCGLLLVTLRNGSPGGAGRPYAEKIMIVREGQLTPMHHHRRKMEDIINRGGGELLFTLHGAAADGAFADGPLHVRIDDIERVLDPGSRVTLAPGQSICLPPGVYHDFQGVPGRGSVLVGEVSSVNDDHGDNFFKEPAGRFPKIDEDEAPYRRLVCDY